MTTQTRTALDALRTQCDVLTRLVAELEAHEWERPTRCPPMSVLDLVAHLVNVAKGTASLARTDASGQEPNTDRAKWWVMPDRRPPADILAASQAAAAELDPVSATEALDAGVRDMIDALSAVAPDAIVGSEDRWRVLPSEELAASRVLEFGVHTMDLGHATLRGERLDDAAAALIVGILDTLLGQPRPKTLGWDTRTFILTGTGRRHLEPNERYTLGPLADRFPLVQ